MIAQRFRPVGWVLGVAVAACILYMISLQVATQRGRLEEIDRKIADLSALRRELGRVLDSCSCDTIADCKIIDALAPRR